MVVAAFFRHELTVPQRLPFLYAFCAVGLAICLQLSQLPEKPPARWARLTRDSKPYWQMVYALEAFLFMQIMYDILKVAIAEYGYDDGFLNALWLALLGLETFLVLGVAARGVARRLKEHKKLKTT